MAVAGQVRNRISKDGQSAALTAPCAPSVHCQLTSDWGLSWSILCALFMKVQSVLAQGAKEGGRLQQPAEVRAQKVRMEG